MKRLSLCRFSLCILLSVLYMAAPTSKPAQADTFPKSLQSAASGHVTILILDMSGSMVQNDPQGLRCSAVNAYIDLSGPGEFIGAIGLTNTDGSRGGPHNFQSAQVWAQPTEMATLSERRGLQNILATKSNQCRPENTTPTYALSQALTMLNLATHQGQIPGSVVLLTDGIPDPDTNEQINAINSELLPQFQAHNWPIDTVALGQDGPIPGMSGTFHSFLSGISNATSGKFYDDGNGKVPGVSPLNIAPFFVNIFAQRNGRTLGPTVDPLSLNGGTIARDFQLGNDVDYLDVIVVKDQPAIGVTLTTPTGQRLPPQVAGTYVSTNDPHYAIFSILDPQPGNWTVTVSGSGQFLMDSLVVSNLQVSITSPSDQSVLPLGQEFTIAATSIYQGKPISGGQFSITGTISYAGAQLIGTVPFTKSLVLTDNASPGTYEAKVTVPPDATPGSYDITVSISQVSNVAIASAHQSLRLELFPVPFLLSPQTNQATDGGVNTVVIRWDPMLQFIYGLPVGFFQWLGQEPLGGLPAQPYAIIRGEVQLKQLPYPDATMTATATSVGRQDSIPVGVSNDGNGFFHVQFQPPADGTYVITFMTRGSFEDTHGDFGTTSRTTIVAIQAASPYPQEFLAWIWTAGYLLALLFILLVLRFFITPAPSGEWRQIEDGEIVAHYAFNQARRSPVQWFFNRNILYSRQVGLPDGLQFRFRQKYIEVRPFGSVESTWRSRGESNLLPGFHVARELVCRALPDNNADKTYEYSTYIIIINPQGSELSKRSPFQMIRDLLIAELGRHTNSESLISEASIYTIQSRQTKRKNEHPSASPIYDSETFLLSALNPTQYSEDNALSSTNMQKDINTKQSLILGSVQGLVYGEHNTVTLNFHGGVELTVPFLAPPLPSYNLVGRDNLLRELKQQLLSGSNLALSALNGLPGVGKTALALALAHDREVLGHFCDGTLWVGLGREANVFSYLNAWGIALGVSQNEIEKLTNPTSLGQTIHRAIGARRMLLVIDDAWSTEAALAFKLGGPHCAHIVTTRLPEVAERFAKEGTITVHELHEIDSLRLLEQQAPGVSAQAPDEIREIIQAVDGLPLPLILMGNYLRIQMKMGQPRRLRAALDRLLQVKERLQLEQPQGGLERHPSLPEGIPLSQLAVIKISDEALDKEAQRVLRALSIFPSKPNSFSEEAALAVAATSTQAIDTLLDFGLLESSGPSRYTLHQTISDYAQINLTDAKVYERMVEFFIEYVQAHKTDRNLLEKETSNILAAVEIMLERGMNLPGASAFAHFIRIVRRTRVI